ncbi:MAG: hypothetical protein LLG15_11090 [Betaproteobacteria bacterium]|nr:hypothetical protein [Betaproteobacteria bacterium]
MSEILSPSEETIEFGGLVWPKTDRAESDEYTAVIPDCGNCRITQYAEGYTKGAWHWMVYFDTLIDPLHKVSVLQMETRGIKPTREEAMQACLDAKDLFIKDIKQLSFALSIGDYATGFKEGQSALAKDIREVLP